MKKKIIGSVLVLGIVAAAAGLFVPNAVQKITKGSQTSTVMETWKKPSAISRMPPR